MGPWLVSVTMRRLAILVLLVSLSACGSGGDGGNGGGGGNPPPPPGGQATYYVRTSGSDSSNGSSPERALRTINAAIGAAKAGATIVVGPGTYAERIVDPRSGAAGAPITYLADPSGTLTTDAAGPVIIDATDVDDPKNSGAAIRFAAASFVVVDGFEITGVIGGSSAGVFIRNKLDDNQNVLPAHDITIRNCRISGNEGDGVRALNSNDILLFNNLIVDNGRRGAAFVGDLTGSKRPQLINNTIARNIDRGVFIGENGAASSGATLRNNIIQDNGGSQNRANLQIDDGSLGDFDSAFNLVFPPRYNPSDLEHDTDVNADAQFVDAPEGDYHLDQGSSPAIDAGDSDLDGDLLRALRVGSTDPDGRPDIGDLDLGYHHPTDQPIPPPGDPRTLYVRGDAGDDANDGLSPATAVSSISLGILRAREGDTVIVGPGLYTTGELTPRDETIILADPDGTATGDEPGEVRIDARSRDAAFLIDRAPGTVIDGFVVTRASVAGIIVRNASHNAIVRNCQVRDSFRDGILVSDADGVLLFNNLVSDNTRHGINITGASSGSNGTKVINNTIARNRDRGLRIGDTDVASVDTLVQNNIIQDNSPNIQVIAGSESGYRGLFNVVFDETYSPADLPHEQDINEDAEFVDPRDDDYHLDQRRSPAVNAADPDTDPPLVTRLRQRSTASDGSIDGGDLDIGFHYP